MLVSSIARFNAFKSVAPAQAQQSANSFNGIPTVSAKPQSNKLFSLKSIKSVAQKLNVFA